MDALTVPSDIDGLIDRQWDRLRNPGSWFTGAERVAIAAAARAGGDLDAEHDGEIAPAAAAARRIYEEPATITREWLAGLEADGLALTEYVEVLGIVSQLRAIDTFEFGVGRPTRPLPEPVAGEPSRAVVAEATINGGWVPTVGPAFPPSVLSSVTAENTAAMDDVHPTLYLAPTAGEGFTMGNMTVVRDGLDRMQMELVAARTSLVNDCFF